MINTKIDQIHFSKIRFLGEQDGLPERDLKARLSRIFNNEPKVQRTYLARVTYPSGENAVALCLRMESDVSDGLLAQRISQVFASMFGKNQHMDIIFMNLLQERELIPLCQPFYKAMIDHAPPVDASDSD